MCYVMPVPRYERDEITLKANYDKVHFEPEKLAAMLPEGAHMADFREFSMERGFERIYIHNPYENGSPLDTVELKYYACNLKKYTKKLIYVPHLMSLPNADNAKYKAYDYVDAIYVPDNKVKYTLEVKYDRKAEIVPSGIPAYLDRLSEKLHAKEKDKMKLLYCVSFENLYYGTERQLAKMRDIFEYARRNQEISLIFRPDEDIVSRRMELNPSVWEEYCKLVAYFRQYRIGVYDQTSDLYEAAAGADGLLCSGHPMAVLFAAQGKYVLYADWVKRAVPSKEDRTISVLWAVTAEEKEDEIEVWFVPERTKLICRMTFPGIAATDTKGKRKVADRKKEKKHLSGPRVEIAAEVPDKNMGGLNYINVTKAGNRLYLSPFSSDGIWKCDLETGCFSKSYLPKAEASGMAETFVYGRYLYMVPRLYPGIVKYDMETEEIKVLDGWVEELEARVSPECKKEPYFVWAVKQEGHMLYMASGKCDIWMELDMDKDVWSLKTMGLPGRRFIHMVKDGEWVWLLPFCGDEIIRWNCATGESRIVCHTVRNEVRNTPYSFLVDAGDAVLAFPQQKTDHVLVMQKSEEGKIRELRNGIPCGPGANLTEYQRLRNSGYQFVKMLNNGLILAYEYYDGSFLLLDKTLRTVRKIPCRLPIEAVRQQEDQVIRNSQVLCGFSGGLSEGNNLPAVMEYFVRHGREDREKIRKYHERY